MFKLTPGRLGSSFMLGGKRGGPGAAVHLQHQDHPLPAGYLVPVQDPEPGLPEVDPGALFLPYLIQVLTKVLVLFPQQLPVLLYPVQQLPPVHTVPALPNYMSRYKGEVRQNLTLPDLHLADIEERYGY